MIAGDCAVVCLQVSIWLSCTWAEAASSQEQVPMCHGGKVEKGGWRLIAEVLFQILVCRLTSMGSLKPPKLNLLVFSLVRKTVFCWENSPPHWENEHQLQELLTSAERRNILHLTILDEHSALSVVGDTVLLWSRKSHSHFDADVQSAAKELISLCSSWAI